jgi:polyamine oxidase
MADSRGDRLDGTRIVVIGAGFAGLAAARDASRRGADVVVLEARDRIGGRVWTDRSIGMPIDLGAAAIHGSVGNPLTALAQAAGAVTRRLEYDAVACYRSTGGRVSDADSEAAAERFEQLRQAVLDHAAEGESLAQAIARLAPGALADPLLALHAGVEFEFDIGASLAEIGATALDDHLPYGGGDLILPGGFDQLGTFLVRGLDIRLGAPVRDVAVSADDVRISGDFGAIDADYAICTLPIGVLQVDDVAFHPPLPPVTATAIARLGAGHVTKVVLRFDQIFWDRDAFYIGYASGNPGRYPWILNPGAWHRDAGILVAFALGDHDRALRDRTDGQVADDVMAALRDIHGDAVESPSEVRVTRWNDDPFSRCSYSFATPKTQRADFEAFEAVVHGRLLFAGEHTVADHRGTAHGAYLSGERAVVRIAALVGA